MALNTLGLRALLTPASPEGLLPLGEALFLHRPHGQPCHGITPEVVADFDRLSRFVLRNRERRRYSAPPHVTFVTYSNRPRPSLIERCYAAYGLGRVVVLGRDVERWDWAVKARLVLEYLESGACATPYLVATDADDMLLVRDPLPLLDRFLSCSCDILFCNTFVDWPPHRGHRDFETLRYYTHPLHCHLNAGGLVAETGALKSRLRELLTAYERREPWAWVGDAFDDQLGWRHLHHEHFPALQVDCACRIFKRYDVFRDVPE